MNADGTEQIRLTSGPEEHGGPVWSPDGTKIAYDTQSAISAYPNTRDIYVMDANGSNQINLTGYESSVTLSIEPDWSPDGSKIAFAAYSDLTSTTATNIHVMNSDGSGITVIDSGYGDTIPSWSSDSSKIAFYTSRDGGLGDTEVFIMDSDGSNPMNISNNPVVYGVDLSGYDSEPAWSPDGNKIAFVSHRSGSFDIWVMDADGSNQVNLTGQATYDGSPAWSPDSTKIAFMSWRSGDAEIYVMNADGSSPVRITDSPGSDGSPSWGVAAPGAAPTPPLSAPTFVWQVGGYGSGTGSCCHVLREPSGVVVDSSEVYVSDWQNNRVMVFDTSGNYQRTWGSEGDAGGDFRKPWGIAVDSSGKLYVQDTGNNRIQKLTPSGGFLDASDEDWGRSNLTDPRHVVTDSQGNVYVTNHGNNHVVKMDSYLNHSVAVLWGNLGSGNGQFNHPRGIAVDSLDNVYISDRLNHRIQKFDSAGNFLFAWGTFGTGDGEFNEPAGIAINSAGNVAVADRVNHRIQMFDPSGNFLVKWGSLGSGNGQFALPEDVAFDSLGNIYVADKNNHLVQKFTFNE